MGVSVDMVFRLSPKQHALLNPLRNGHNCLGVPHIITALHCYWSSRLALFPTPPDNKQDRRIVDSLHKPPGNDLHFDRSDIHDYQTPG